MPYPVDNVSTYSTTMHFITHPNEAVSISASEPLISSITHRVEGVLNTQCPRRANQSLLGLKPGTYSQALGYAVHRDRLHSRKS